MIIRAIIFGPRNWTISTWKIKNQNFDLKTKIVTNLDLKNPKFGQKNCPDAHKWNELKWNDHAKKSWREMEMIWVWMTGNSWRREHRARSISTAGRWTWCRTRWNIPAGSRSTEPPSTSTTSCSRRTATRASSAPNTTRTFWLTPSSPARRNGYSLNLQFIRIMIVIRNCNVLIQLVITP